MSTEISLKKLATRELGKALKSKKKNFGVIALLTGIIAFTILYPNNNAPVNDYAKQVQQLQDSGELLKADFSLTKETEEVEVVSITDGDTIKVKRSNGETVPVRYIGIDTPEIKHQGNGTEETFGKEATELNTYLVSGKHVFLKQDITDTDKYDRLLRYVYLENGTMVNYIIIRLGYANMLTIQPNSAFQQKFLLAYQQAREEELALHKPK
jgi:micrococcal nuclease